jgi:hypothetical protein
MRVTRRGEVFMPENAIQTMPRSALAAGVRRYFYARGSYEISVPPGNYEIEVVRGICHEVASATTEVSPGITRVIDFSIPLLRDLRASGWYSGNTHTHFHLDLEEDPDDHLRLVPPAEDLDISVISHLIRGDSAYPSNRYPIGRLPQFSGNGTLIDVGEEARNNEADYVLGYGHCLFLNIPRLVEPVSTGLLAPGGKAPDFPTLTMLCERTKQLGGTTVWCHNGQGMELPVAVALGAIDAFNLADGREAEYQRYYNLLNCGFRLPVSSGTDWWIYDHNRVFVQTGANFSYEEWLAGLRAGRTYVSNGPLLEFTVDSKPPGTVLQTEGRLRVKASAISRLPFERLEIVRDGEIVAEQLAINMREAAIEQDISVDRGGWLAARICSRAKTHAGYTVFAHSSPVYFRVPNTPFRRAAAAGAFIDEIEESVRFIRKRYRFASQGDQALALGRFEAGRQRYIQLAAQA